MNTQILNKCIEELKKDKPDLSYIRGILETLVDSVPKSQWEATHPRIENNVQPGSVPANTIELSDEEREAVEYARRYNTGPVAELQ